jgi:UDP-N-acetylmuramyl pentapeptide phosphotransferase/UDP-N-acetylglucosamine-1-phosphate transferase
VSEAWIAVLPLPAVIAAAIIVGLARSPAARLWIDRPNERSLHQAPTPRLGGIGVMAGALPIAAACAGGSTGVALACAFALAVVSAVDDWRSLPVAVRLPAHAMAAFLWLALVAAGREGVGLPLAIGLGLALVWMTNLYNFMDGSDGLAGAMALVGFGALAVAAERAGQSGLALTCAALASAAAGFLAINAPPARVFLGDAGSVPLGFLAAALGAQGFLDGAWPAWFPVLVFSPFIVDATATLIRRLAAGERVWVAHRSHHYQRLVLGGWSPRRLVVAESLLMLAAAGSALHALGAGEMLQCGILVGWSVLYGALLIALRLMRPANKNMNGNGARKSKGAPGEQE